MIASLSRREWLWAVMLFTALTFLRVGNWNVRTANAISDDHPVTWAKFAQAPERWNGDPIQIGGPFFVKAALQNRIPAFLLRHFGVPPELPSVLLVLFQNVALGLMLLCYVRFFDPKPAHYWPAAVAAFVARPWSINFAYFPDVMYVPYAAHLSLAFVMAGLIFYLRDERRKFLGLMLVSAVVHPVQTLHLLFVLFFILLADEKRRAQLGSYLSLFLAVALMAGLPQLLAASPVHGALTSHEYYSALLRNLHVQPWKLGMIWAWVLPTFTGFLFLAGTFTRNDRGPMRAIILGGAVAAGLGLLIHITAVKFKIPFVMILLMPRNTVLVSLFVLPLLFLFFARAAVGSASGGVRVSAALALFFPMYSGFGLFWGQALGVLAGTKRIRGISVSAALCGVWIVLFLLFGFPFRAMGWASLGSALRNGLAPAAGFDSVLFFVSLALALAVAFLPRGKAGQRLTVAVLALALIFHARNGLDTFRGPLREQYDIQKWAIESTPPESLFMSMTRTSWRAISQRPVVYVDIDETAINPYWRDRGLSDWGKRVGKLFSVYGTDLDAFDQNKVVELGRSLGAKYVLRSTKAAPLNLPLVYRGATDSVYQLP